MSFNRVAGVGFTPGKLALAIAGLFFSGLVLSNPSSPQVANGQASFVQQGNVLSITNTPGTVINWQSFSVGSGETTRFIQQNAASAVLNRVQGSSSSQILGSLLSNGQVYLVNPNGILFGAGARVDVAGLVASSLQISDRDFLAGNLRFTGTSTAGAVRNDGVLQTPAGGRILLLAPNVENNGLIHAPGGQVLLAAGSQVSLVDGDNPDVQVVVSATGDQVLNLGQIIAESGRVGIYGALVKQAGKLSADSAVQGEGGRIFLRATRQAVLTTASETSASGGRGGVVEVDSTGETQIAGRVSVTGSLGTGGEVRLLGENVSLGTTALVDASGLGGGGSVLVGGDLRGQNSAVHNAESTNLAAGARVLADAGERGDGGKVVLWAQGAAAAHGTISARGGSLGGNGGTVETSGKQLDISGVAVDTRAALGKTGFWLLDPLNIVIDGIGGTSDATTSRICIGGGASCGVGLIDWLASNQITMTATDGVISLNAPLAWDSGNSLILRSVSGDVLLASNISSSNAAGAFQAIATGVGKVRTLPGVSITLGGSMLLNGESGVTVGGPLTTLNSGQNIIIISSQGGVQLDAPIVSSGSLSVLAGIGGIASGTGDLRLEAPSGALSLSGSTTVSGKARLLGQSITLLNPLVANHVELQTDTLLLSPTSASIRANGTGGSDGVHFASLSSGREVSVSSLPGAGLTIDPASLTDVSTPAAGQISANNFFFSANDAPVTFSSPLSLSSASHLSAEGSRVSQSAPVSAGEIEYQAQGGNIAISNTLSASSQVALRTVAGSGGTTGNINQSATGKILTPSLSIDALGSVAMNLAGNEVSQLAATVGGNLSFRNVIDLTTTGIASSKPGGGSISLVLPNASLTVAPAGIDACLNQTSACSGSISLDNTGTGSANMTLSLLRAGVVNLATSGNISDGDGSSVNNVVHPSGGVAQLTYQVGGTADLDAWGAQLSGTPSVPNANINIRTTQFPVLPTLAECVVNPTLTGCASVLPTLGTCIATPSALGCSVVLPSLSACIAAPATAGCSVVLPTLAQCTAHPASSGCSVVLPTLSACTANPTLAGCGVVLPSLSACIAAPVTAGCSAVLPALAQCLANPSASGCSVVLPTLSACIAEPSVSGCSVVLPGLGQCVSNAALPGCSVVLPSLDRCVLEPAAAGCSVVLPTTDSCIANPSAEGCIVVLPAARLIASESNIAPVVVESVQSSNTIIETLTPVSYSSSQKTTSTTSTTTSGTQRQASSKTKTEDGTESNTSSGGQANAPQQQTICN